MCSRRTCRLRRQSKLICLQTVGHTIDRAVSLNVLYEDNHLLVINKPAGLITMGSPGDERSAVKLAADYLKQKYNKPGNVFVGVVSRLDRLVSGVLVFARTSKAAARLSEQFREHTTEKHYRAWVEGRWELSEETELTDWMSKNEAAQRMTIVSAGARDAQLAQLKIRTVRSSAARSMMAIELLTGRKHQIRLQLAERGHPILGDRKYAAKSPFPRGIALHSLRLMIKHPTRDEQLTFEAPVPDYWPA